MHEVKRLYFCARVRDERWRWASLRSKRFQSSYRAKVRAGAKKNGGRGRGRGEEVPSFPSSSPVIPFFFCSRPNFVDELARKLLLRRLTLSIALIFNNTMTRWLEPRGGGVLPYITYTGMCRPTGSWFWSSWFRTGYPFQRRFLERGMKNCGSRLYLLLKIVVDYEEPSIWCISRTNKEISF